MSGMDKFHAVNYPNGMHCYYEIQKWVYSTWIQGIKACLLSRPALVY